MNGYQFVHLNVHSHYSIMDGCASIKELVDAAIKDRMPGIAITDNGNMFGAMEFFDYVSCINNERRQKEKKPFKPIIGCELYVAPGEKECKRLAMHCKGYRLTVIAKNYQGYKNLIKIVSNSRTDGFYLRPRTDHSYLEKYHEGLLVLSGGVGSELYSLTVNNDMVGLDATIKWYKQIFGEDYYLELQRNTVFDSENEKTSALILEQSQVNTRLRQKAKEFGVKVVATNDVHYVTCEDSAVYNILQCDAMAKTMDEFAQSDIHQYRWLRSRKEMCDLFSDVPKAIANTIEIFDKVEFYDICHAPIVPAVSIPDGFGNERREKEDNYLEYLSFFKAKQIYGESLPEEVSVRLKFELQIIKQRGASGYFLFLQDVVNTAQSELGVCVGPGRGSAAGSLTCYCLGITKIDPLKHGLLFERFLSPEGSMFPDIDIDFDYEGRKRVINWLQQKYGKECCAHIVAFSQFSTSNAFNTVIRSRQMITPETIEVKELLSSHRIFPWRSIKHFIKSEPEVQKIIRKAGMPLRNVFAETAVLERKIKGLDGVHPCGFVVADEPVSNWAPVSTISIEDPNVHEQLVNCTQFDRCHVNSSGLIKFDFLGIKALLPMKKICEIIKDLHDKDFDIEKIPIDDVKTMELFQAGKTDEVFMFSTKGMQKYLQYLHPTCFEDLVILYSMYRPGPLDDIPTLIEHKNSKKKIKYLIPCMEKCLQNTYGIIVYQEQLMMLSCLIADFTKGESDLLRNAISKKKTDVLSIMKPKFIEGGMKNGHKKNALEKVWYEIERKGKYTFNKSHAVCYTWIGYQYAYLKANYPDEFKQVMEEYNVLY